MKSKPQKITEMRPEYDFDYTKAVRGKYAGRLLKASNIAVLEPDVAKAFPSSSAVNGALRQVLKTAAASRRAKARVRGRG